MGIRALCYDWDGVIQDSMPEIYRGVCAVFAAEGLAPPTLEYFCQRVTMPFDDWYRRHGIIRQTDTERQALYLRSTNTKSAPLFPGVAESVALVRQRGVKTAIVSAAAVSFIDGSLLRSGLMDVFDLVISGLASKTVALQAACDMLGVPYHEAAYVGDLTTDVEAAQAAGLKTVAFVGPYGDASVFSPLNPDYVVHSHAEIAEKLFP